MKYEDAQNSVLAYLGSDIGRDLDEDQAEQLTRKLTYTVRNNGPIVPEAVAVHADQLFPESEEDEMQRVVPPRQPRQSREQAIAVITDFLNTKWGLVAPGCLLPTPTESKINHKLFFDEVNAWVKQGGLVRADYLADMVAKLRGLLEKPAPPQPVVVEPPAPPSPREIAQKQYALDRRLNNRDTSPIRGAKAKAASLTPNSAPLTEEAKAAINGKNEADNEIIQTALWRVNNFLGHTHGRTASGRAALKETFENAMNEGKTAQEVLEVVVSKIDELAGNSSIR